MGNSSYLGLIKNHKYRTAKAQLRPTSHTLAIEHGRYTHPKTKLKDRCCLFCPRALEDEKHFLVGCVVNKTERDFILESRTLISKFQLLRWRRFFFLLNSKDQQMLTWVGKFIHNSLKTRNEKLVLLRHGL